MPKIHILPDRVANQIAAGEVVERPAAVVKELVENALDAGATRIEVEFRQGGRELLRVEDNGSGMTSEDAQLALKRHATSKISETSDLDRIASFGFRGEALPSIASVSTLTLRTRAAQENAGTEILVEGGKTIHVRDCGRPVVTSVEAARLFHPVPARQKFLKTDATEGAHIVQCVRLYALACPGVAFSLIEDGRKVFASPRCATLADRCGEIFGQRMADLMLPLDVSDQGMRLSGLIGRPGDGRSTRQESMTFVNGRPVDSRALNYALMEGYRESLPQGRYPRAVLFLECDPADVDVNVHPSKREVRFRREQQVRGFVIRCVLDRLREEGAAAGALAAPARPGVFGLGEAAALYGSLALPSRQQPGSEARPAKTPEAWVTAPDSPPTSAGDAAISAESRDRYPGMAVSPPASRVPGPANAGRLRAWRFVGMSFSQYVLFETASGIVIVDRRAAHERIWFERLRSQFAESRSAGQRLLLPVSLELEPVAAAMLIEARPFIEAHGFEVADFGRNFFRIEAAPQWMEPADAEPFLRDILGELREGKLSLDKLDLAREEFARLAAARAIRLPSSATPAEMESLVSELFNTGSPHTSPTGRPTFIEIDRTELARRFHSSG